LNTVNTRWMCKWDSFWESWSLETGFLVHYSIYILIFFLGFKS
jgi:hypothetical protein